MSTIRTRKNCSFLRGAAALATAVVVAVPRAQCFGPPHMRTVPVRQRGPFRTVLQLAAPAVEETELGTTVDAERDQSIAAPAAGDERENPRLSGLALLLDDGTRKSHSVAQNSAFVSGFFKGIATESSFSSLVGGLYFVYESMETAFDATTDEAVKLLDDPRLRRLSSLERDLAYFYGDNWKEDVVPSKATLEYVKRVEEVANGEKPYLLVAHQYTRYLGDLFGGQMMGGMATRSLGLEEGKGTAFYTFDDIPSTKLFIDDWYTRLNDLDFSDAQKREIVDEANLVFDLNIGILEELEGSPFRAMFALAIKSVQSKLGFK